MSLIRYLLKSKESPDKLPIKAKGIIFVVLIVLVNSLFIISEVKTQAQATQSASYAAAKQQFPDRMLGAGTR